MFAVDNQLLSTRVPINESTQRFTFLPGTALPGHDTLHSRRAAGGDTGYRYQDQPIRAGHSYRGERLYPGSPGATRYQRDLRFDWPGALAGGYFTFWPHPAQFLDRKS